MKKFPEKTGKEKRFGFSGAERLKSRKSIESIFSEGISVSRYPLRLIYIRTGNPSPGNIQAGVAVPKRNFKSAVSRNRIKRLLRESYRRNKEVLFNNIEGGFAFLFLYLGKEMPEYAQIELGMLKVFKEFIKKINDEEEHA